MPHFLNMAAIEVAKDVLLFNTIKVKIDDKHYISGIVKYIGGIMGKKGVFVGIDVTEGKGKNDGTYKGIKYFDTKNGGKTGRFTSLELDKVHITKTAATDNSLFHFHWGETVYCTETKCKGTVRYIGIPSWSESGNVHYGLELAKKKGDHNGTFEGIQYFQCKPKYGIYVDAEEVDDSDEFQRKKKKKKRKKAKENGSNAAKKQMKSDKKTDQKSKSKRKGNKNEKSSKSKETKKTK